MFWLAISLIAAIVLVVAGTVMLGFCTGLWQERAHLRAIRRANRAEENEMKSYVPLRPDPPINIHNRWPHLTSTERLLLEEKEAMARRTSGSSLGGYPLELLGQAGPRSPEQQLIMAEMQRNALGGNYHLQQQLIASSPLRQAGLGSIFGMGGGKL